MDSERPASEQSRAGASGEARTRVRARALVLGFVFVALVLASVVLWRTQERFEQRPAPDLSFGLIDGSRIALSELRGRVVLVDFWATSCVVCVAEMPGLARLHRELAPRGLVTVAVAMPYDRPDFVVHFARTRDLPFAVALDPMGQAVRALGPVRGTPTLLLIDRSGTIVDAFEGSIDFPGLRAAIERALAG